MKKKPVIFLSFANDSENSNTFLKELEPEKEALQDILVGEDGANDYLPYIAPTSEPAHLVKHLNKFYERVVIFHFSGHSNGDELILDALEGGKIPLPKQSLASILISEKNLKLVVLNACQTEGQVPWLHDNGVPLVIATSDKVLDEEARAFAETFYDSLLKNHTVKEAYLKAETVIRDNKETGRIYRDVIPGNATEELAWGLYYRDEKALNWKLKDILSTPHPYSPFIMPSLITILLFLIGLIPVEEFYSEIELKVDRVQFRVMKDWVNDSLLSLDRFRTDDVDFITMLGKMDTISEEYPMELYLNKIDSVSSSGIKVNSFPVFGEKEVVQVVNEYVGSEAYFLQSGESTSTFQVDYVGAIAKAGLDGEFYHSFLDSTYEQNSLSISLGPSPKFWMRGTFNIDFIKVDSLSFKRIIEGTMEEESAILGGKVYIPSLEKEMLIKKGDTLTIKFPKGTLSVSFEPYTDKMNISFQGKVQAIRCSNEELTQKVRVNIAESIIYNKRAELYWLLLSGLISLIFPAWKHLKSRIFIK